MNRSSNRKIRVGVIFGGRSGEHEVSIRSAQSVMNAMDRTKYEVVPIGITKEGRWLMDGDPVRILKQAADQKLIGGESGASCTERNEAGFENSAIQKLNTHSLIPSECVFQPLDVVFPVLHGPFGEDGTMQGLLDLVQTAYVGCGVLASSVAMDKILFKDVMTSYQIPVVPYVSFIRSQLDSDLDSAIDRIENTFDYPLFCKPANLGSSVGISKCHDRRELADGLREAAKYDRRILVEIAVPNAREIEVSVLGNDRPIASTPGEIIPSREFYDYQAKYLDNGENSSKLLIPANLSQELTAKCRDYAVRSFCAVDGAGMARVDFLLNRETGELFLNEINTIPGFTSISMYPKLWQASGISYAELIDALIQLAIERFEDRKRNKVEFSL